MASNGLESSGLNLWIRQWRFTRRMRLANEKYDAFVMSVPKSGRTWHRLLLGKYLTAVLCDDSQNALKLDDLCQRAGIKRVSYTHNWTSHSDKLPPSSLVVASPIEWHARDVLLIVRDPRDVLVSAFHHCRYREQCFEGTISEFIRHPYAGIEKLLTAHNRWYEKRHLALSFDVISYEQMHLDPEAALLKCLMFAGFKDPDPQIIKESVKFSSLESMQKMEQSDYFKSVEMQNSSGDPRARKVRSGKIGSFREVLSSEDIGYIDDAIRRMGNPFA